MYKLMHGVGALLVLAVLLVGTPIALLAWIGNPWPPGGWAEVQLFTNRTLYGVLGIIGWLAWAQMTACILLEVAAVARGAVSASVKFAPQGQQRFARALVVSVAAIGIGASAIANATAATPATSNDTTADQNTHRTHASDARVEVHAQQATTLWNLAETHLGKGTQWRDVLAANRGTTMADGTTLNNPAQTIPAGTTLRLPRDPAARTVTTGDEPSRSYTVKPGDTLWQISETTSGDPTRYREIYRASTHIDQLGTTDLTDPDHIEPGWKLTIPDHGGTPAELPPEPKKQEAERPQQDATPKTAPRETTPRSSGETKPEEQDDTREGAGQAEHRGERQPADEVTRAGASDDRDGGGISALRAVLATTTVLSAGALAMILVNRRRQFRERRAGRTIAATPRPLAAAERAVLEHGAAAMEATVFIDRALRHLAASQRVAHEKLPHLGAVLLDSRELAVLFTEAALSEAPTGWEVSSDGLAWTLPRETILEADLMEQPAPYPALVTVGVDEQQRTWLLDLEATGVVGIAGQPEDVQDLVRLMVAELALNRWSAGAEVLLTGGFASETVNLDPTRIRQVSREEAERRGSAVLRASDEGIDNTGLDVLDLRRDAVDAPAPVVVVAPGATLGSDLLASARGRDRSRVVVIHDEDDAAIELTGNGAALLPRWGITLHAAVLPAPEAKIMADLVESTRRREDEPMPPAPESKPLGRVSTVDGALRTDLTEPREGTQENPGSLLPAADEVYVRTAATTTEDLAALAPNIPEERRGEIEALDPGLDQDVADWWDPESPRPKVQCLGPVDVLALGGDEAKIPSKGSAIEFIVFLSCQEGGMTPDRAAEALAIAPATLHNRATWARKLLGTRPDGRDWLPDAAQSRTAQQRGIATYELDPDILVAADIFRRLRGRAQDRGPAGVNDLTAALSLVGGEPFDQLRRGGYGWLLEGDRLDHHLCSAILDVAHLVVLRALADGDQPLARWACETAMQAVPEDDRPRLDLAAVMSAEGDESVDKVLLEQVIDRFDEDPTARTEKVLHQRGWLAS